MPSHYRLTGRIETGDLAEIYAALRDDYEEEVVIKLFHPRTSDATYAQRLSDTARIVASVEDPGIVPYLEIGMVRDRLAVVRPKVDGFSLRDAMARLATRDVVLPASIALILVLQLLEAVERANQAGAIHGAITPSNVLLTQEGRLVVQDFGSLRALLAAPALRKEFGAKARGPYCAPELSRGEPPTTQSDVYAIGAITYELVTLREPTSSTVSTRREPVLPPSRIDRRLNARLDPIVMRAIDAAPQRRFHSCAEFSAALRNFLANNGGMPLREDVGKFISDVEPHSPPSLAPAPFAEPFSLTPIERAGSISLPQHPITEPPPAAFNAEQDSTQVADPKAMLSELAPTMAAQPALSEVAPTMAAQSMLFDDETAAGEHPMGLTDPGDSGPAVGPALLPLVAVPPTRPDQGRPAALEAAEDTRNGWIAPPGTSGSKARKGASGGARAPARAARVRMVEDFSAPPVSEPTPVNAPAAQRTAPAALPEQTDPQVPTYPAPSPTLEKRLFPQAVMRRRRMRGVALGLAGFGIFSFVAVLRFAGQAAPPVPPGGPAADQPIPEGSDPAYRTVDGALKKYLQAEGVAESAPSEEMPSAPVAPGAQPERAPNHPAVLERQPVLAPSGHDEGEVFDEPPSKRAAGFLTVTSDLPASVYIDGLKVRRRTPLFRYPVQPGDRKIVIEAVSTLERRPFQLTIKRGQTTRVQEKFRQGR